MRYFPKYKGQQKAALSFLIAQLFILSVNADNPVIQTCYTADPAPLVYNDRVYMYVGHDSSAAPASSYLMRDWKCYSSNDMVNWTDHGVVLRSNQFKWGANDANAAQCVYRDGKFYYYVSTGGTGGIAIGIAVASSPLGPFTDIGQPLLTAAQMSGCNATHTWRGLDPTVFIEEDGKAYLYTGNNGLFWVTLNSNMTSFTGTVNCLAQNNTASFGPDYEEAPWFYKRGNLYYLVYASQFPECIRYSTSSSPLGPWTYKGQVMGTQPNGVSNTIHPGVCDFAGNSYYFYHNARLPGGGSYKRSVCIEQFKYNTDGTIPLINETGDGVVTGVRKLDPYDTTQAETICWESGIRTNICSEGGIMVDSITNGDYIKVEGVDFGEGANAFEARVASGGSGGKIELHLDSQTGKLIGTCDIAATGGWDKWVSKTCDITDASAVHDLYLKFTGGSGLLFNFDWWKFKSAKVDSKNAVKHNSGNALNINLNNNLLTVTCGSLTTAQKTLTAGLYSLSGRFIIQQQMSSDQSRLVMNLNNVIPGTYFVKVNANGKILTKRINIK